MKLPIILLLIIFTSQSIAQNLDGGTVGNGGGVWVCQDSLNAIKKIELVDFFEAEKEFDYVIKSYEGLNYQDILKSYQQRISDIDTNLGKELSFYFKEIIPSIKLVDSELEVIDDALYRLKPSPFKWCAGEISYQQLANYTDYGKILLSEYLFNHSELSELERAGLILHEVIYKYMREANEERNSVNTRRIVGIIASDLETKKARSALSAIISLANGPEDSCGLKGTIEARIRNCAGKKYYREDSLILVSLNRELEMDIGKDPKTGLLWSNRLMQEMTHYDAEKACLSNLKETAGIKASWKLPSIEEILDARNRSLVNIDNGSWTRSLHPHNPEQAWVFDSVSRTFSRSEKKFVMCIANEK